MGSTELARCAGHSVATSATNDTASAVPTKTRASLELIPNTRFDINLANSNASGTPKPNPTIVRI
jgi:hypothetical protein